MRCKTPDFRHGDIKRNPFMQFVVEAGVVWLYNAGMKYKSNRNIAPKISNSSEPG